MSSQSFIEKNSEPLRAHLLNIPVNECLACVTLLNYCMSVSLLQGERFGAESCCDGGK